MRPHMISIAIAVLPACAPAIPEPTAHAERPRPQLGRFMREMVNIPYSFALFANHRPGRQVRVHRAALALHDAVQDLVHWSDPPGGSDSARSVFYAYAQNLESQVGSLELAARAQDMELAAHSLETIRQTCNQCHRFFRPAAQFSADVAPDLYVLELGGWQ